MGAFLSGAWVSGTLCVRRAFLLGEDPLDRKEWIDEALLEAD